MQGNFSVDFSGPVHFYFKAFYGEGVAYACICRRLFAKTLEACLENEPNHFKVRGQHERERESDEGSLLLK